MDHNIILQENELELKKALVLAHHTVYKKYLMEIEKYLVVEPTLSLLDEEAKDCIRLLRLKEFTCKKNEDIFQKLSTVYHASMELGCHFVVMIDVERNDAPAKIYIGVRNDGKDDEARKKLMTSFSTLKKAMNSNFPGTQVEDVPSQQELPNLLDGIFGNTTKHISSVSCVAGIRDKSKTEQKNFIQGIERLIDAMQGNTYTALFISEPIQTQEIENIRRGYETLYSIFAPFENNVWSYNENESYTVMDSLSRGISSAVTKGISDTQSHTKTFGESIGFNSVTSNNVSISNSESKTNTKFSTGTVIGSTINVIGNVVGKTLNPLAGLAVSSVGGIINPTFGGSDTEGVVKTLSYTMGRSFGVSSGLNTSETESNGKTISASTTDTDSKTQTKSNSSTNGYGKTLQIQNINKTISEMLKRIDEQLKRVQEGEDYGTYNCSAYFLSGKQENTLLAANIYRSLMIGDGSSIESGAINSWNGNRNPEKVKGIKEYLRRFVHPIFALPVSDEDRVDTYITYTPATIVSGLELPLHLGLPTKSVYGMPVSEHAEFGRNVVKRDVLETDEKKIPLGNIYHMGMIEKKSFVHLSINELASHTFVTGSTGSGKSNTVYEILSSLQKNNIKFLVVEPAKGEYKTAFGDDQTVVVYGTNPNIHDMNLLRINPFSFPEEIHILEHMDRLVEIFNVCWPMYAAMPAILKDAIERAYVMAGWDLVKSKNKYDNRLFPSFMDVLKQIKIVLNESDYSSDNKGDYTGALITRIRSLTTGINSLIFSPEAIAEEDLFDRNAIVDLSRIGSTETKSLIMGLLILKLQEHRMQNQEINAELKHVTVLEEAHNILRKTTFEQSAESSNLLGKSVEMISNAIAEMRTYGEGFIIADQSPGLLDMSAIRNTNTKIILRLPDYSDRELVGKAAGLNENQIIELGRLERGVAAISQSGWIEPVLCKINKFEKISVESGRENFGKEFISNIENIENSLLECIMNKEIYRKGDRVDIQKLRDRIIHSNIDTIVKCEFIDYITTEKEKEIEKLRPLIFDFLKAGNAIKISRNCNDFLAWSNKVIDILNPSIKGYSNKQINLVLALIVYEQAERDSSYNDICCRFMEYYKSNGGIF
ncbi:ATP-binding protein [Anaerotignum lactatifermentans]|uniref:ATP-binding protein n=1 Tax=Anaerotignum lactatifermentans TaxID=160404 RepID=UPI001FAB5B84|nr:ATP-binding protein [Anaerotignum lactatifermentans]